MDTPVHKIWRDGLSPFKQYLDIDPFFEKDFETIIDTFVADRLDPKVFISNLEALLRKSVEPTILELSKKSDSFKPTKSISHYISVINRPGGVPLWFIAGYPDVTAWFHEQREACIQSHKELNDDTGKKILGLFGVDANDNTVADSQIFDFSSRIRPKYYGNLIKRYKNITGKDLELKADFENDIYSGFELLKTMGTESNYTLIAEIITKYYLELTKNYKDRFNNEATIFATAGILDAHGYIFMKKISPLEIVDIANKSNKESSLINFIIELEVRLFQIDNPNLTVEDIRNACEGQREAIEKAIQKVKDTYISELNLSFSSNVDSFMKPRELGSLRKMIGIKDSMEDNFARPFYENKTKAEFREWFSKVPSWNKVDQRIIDALIGSFYGNPMFEVFVHTSWELDLVKMYVPPRTLLTNEGIDLMNIQIIGEITKILYQAGCSCQERVIKLMSSQLQDYNEIKKDYCHAVDAFESSIHLQRTFLPAYFQLAFMKHLLKKDDEAKELCNQGLIQVEEMKKSPLRLSSPELHLVDAVKEGEEKLKAMLKELQV